MLAHTLRLQRMSLYNRLCLLSVALAYQRPVLTYSHYRCDVGPYVVVTYATRRRRCCSPTGMLALIRLVYAGLCG